MTVVVLTVFIITVVIVTLVIVIVVIVTVVFVTIVIVTVVIVTVVQGLGYFYIAKLKISQEQTRPICRHCPLGAGLPSGLCGKEGALPAVTGLTDQMDYLILVIFNKELE